MKGDLSVEQAQAQHKKRFKMISSKKLEGQRLELYYGQQGYPESLMLIEDSPEILYAIGNIHALRDGLAVIGTRKATPYGASASYQFAKHAAQRGIPIVSGGAIGCDTQAHKGALDACGETVVVLGGGCDQLYPSSNADLFQQVIDQGGVVVSERHWDFPPLPYTFRARNRIIAALARATLIVEAGLPSGTFSTADDALSAGKDVLVVPGPITSPTSLGANRLIYQGATPIVDLESFEDVLVGTFGCLRMDDARPSTGYTPIRGGISVDETDQLLMALLANPMRIEQLLNYSWDEQEREGCTSSDHASDKLTRLMVRLASYERDGLIARFPDGRYGPAQV